MVSFLHRVVVPSDVLVRILDREAVLLNLQTERYFGLDETGTRMWQLLAEAPRIEHAYDLLLAEFEVEPELLRANLSELIDKLVENGLVQLVPADVGTISTV